MPSHLDIKKGVNGLPSRQASRWSGKALPLLPWLWCLPASMQRPAVSTYAAPHALWDAAGMDTLARRGRHTCKAWIQMQGVAGIHERHSIRLAPLLHELHPLAYPAICPCSLPTLPDRFCQPGPQRAADSHRPMADGQKPVLLPRQLQLLHAPSPLPSHAAGGHAAVLQAHAKGARTGERCRPGQEAGCRGARGRRLEAGQDAGRI